MPPLCSSRPASAGGSSPPGASSTSRPSLPTHCAWASPACTRRRFPRALKSWATLSRASCGSVAAPRKVGARALAWLWSEMLAEDTIRGSTAGPGPPSPPAPPARLPFADASFDAVLCAQSTLGLLGDQKPAVLAEAARVVRPDAQLTFVGYSELSVVPRVEWD